MADKPVPLTRDGQKRLEQQLEQLKAERQVVADHINKSQELGTSQHDAEYEGAKEEQSMLEGRILDLEDTLRRAEVIDETDAHTAGLVMLGSGVEVDQDGTTRHYQIVGPPEAHVASGRISNESPIGQALLGHTVGDTVDINVPRGLIRLKILKID